MFNSLSIEAQHKKFSIDLRPQLAKYKIFIKVLIYCFLHIFLNIYLDISLQNFPGQKILFYDVSKI